MLSTHAPLGIIQHGLSYYRVRHVLSLKDRHWRNLECASDFFFRTLPLRLNVVIVLAT